MFTWLVVLLSDISILKVNISSKLNSILTCPLYSQVFNGLSSSSLFPHNQFVTIYH